MKKKNVVKLALMGLAVGATVCGCNSKTGDGSNASCSGKSGCKGKTQNCSGKTGCKGQNGCTGKSDCTGSSGCKGQNGCTGRADCTGGMPSSGKSNG